MEKPFVGVVISALFLAILDPVHAQTYPAKPVRILVGYVPGGGVDTTARIMAAALTEVWGQQVIVENRPGAAGNIATELTAKAPPDGYTLVLCNIGSHSITPARFRATLTYDHVRDFAFPVMIGSVPNVFMTHPSLPPRTLREFIAYAKARPGQINFGSSGVGASPHLSIELLNSMTGIKLVHVPYKGPGAALSDVLGGQVPLYFMNILGAMPLVKANKLKALGITSAERSPIAPQLTTLAEAGLKDFDMTNWYGLLVPGATPREVIARLQQEIARIMGLAEISALMARGGMTVVASTPEQFSGFLSNETAKYAKVIKLAGVKPE